MRSAVRLELSDDWLARGQEPLTAARVGDLVFTAGVPGIDLATGVLPAEPERQFALAFDNLRRLLDRAGVSPGEVGLVTVYIPDPSYRQYINDPWLALYPVPNRPARKTNQLPLPEGMVIQVQANAVAGAARTPLEIPGLAHRDPLPMGAKLGRMVFSSVIGGQDPATGANVEGAVPQIEQAFDNMRLLMEQAGGSADGINHVWVFLRDFAHQPAMVERWVDMFPTDGDRPARKTLRYELGGSSEVQVQLVGVLGGTRRNFEVPGVSHHDPIPLGSAVGGMFHSSGIYGVDPATGRIVEGGGLPRYADVSLATLEALVGEAGGTLDGIGQVTVLLRSYGDARFAAERLARLFPDPDNRPAYRFVTYRMPDTMLIQFMIAGVIG